MVHRLRGIERGVQTRVPMRRYTALGVWREKTFGSFNANIDSNTEEEKFQTVIAESGVDDAASSRVLPVVWRVWSNHPVHVASLVKVSPSCGKSGQIIPLMRQVW